MTPGGPACSLVRQPYSVSRPTMRFMTQTARDPATSQADVRQAQPLKLGPTWFLAPKPAQFDAATAYRLAPPLAAVGLRWEGGIEWLVLHDAPPRLQELLGHGRAAPLPGEHGVQPLLGRFLGFGLVGGHHHSLSIVLKSTVEPQSHNQVLSDFISHLGEQQFDQKRRAEDLLEVGFELRADAEANEPAQTHVLRRTRERLHVRRVDRRLAQLLEVSR